MKMDECQGIITLRDARRIIAKHGFDSLKKKVVEVMTRKLITIGPSATSGEAGAIMGRKKIDHLPVVDEEGLVEGIISAKDLIFSMTGRSILVKELMTKKIVTISSTSSLLEAVKLMEKKNIASLVVK